MAGIVRDARMSAMRAATTAFHSVVERPLWAVPAGSVVPVG